MPRQGFLLKSFSMELVELRKYLHQHPELSSNEQKTAAFVSDKLKEVGVKKVYQNFSEHTVLAEIEFPQPGETVLFRAELDALPIPEKNTFSHRSDFSNISHKCGHDGHMTILLGLAEKLVQEQNFSGKVLLLFQSSEEIGKGAQAILDSEILNHYTIQHVFALHNVPGFPLGSIVCKSGAFTPSVESLDIVLAGKESHAGMPENGINPAASLAKIIQYFEHLHQPEKKQHFLATPIQINMGKAAYGTSAGNAIISYTFRGNDPVHFKKQKESIAKKIQEIVKKTQGLQVSLEWKEAFAANTNNQDAYKTIKKVAAENQFPFIEKEKPFSWGEDFGSFTQSYSGAMFGLGAGENTPELHNPDYDFPDALLEKGIAMFYSLAKYYLR